MSEQIIKTIRNNARRRDTFRGSSAPLTAQSRGGMLPRGLETISEQHRRTETAPGHPDRKNDSFDPIRHLSGIV